MIRRSSLSSVFAIACVLSASSRAWAQHVLVVDAGGPYTQIQPAVDAAANGDTVLVHAGIYDGFTIGDKELSVVAAIGATVHVLGRVRIDNFSHSHAVLLANLQIHPAGSQPPGAPALGAQNNSGSIRVERCTIAGWNETSPWAPGQVGVQLDGDADVAFSSCTIQGGHGSPGSHHDSLNGAAGGHAISARSCRVAIYDCILRGGPGGDGISGSTVGEIGGEGGRGGAGYRLDDGFLFVGNSQVYGGDGGGGGPSAGDCNIGSPPGPGGPGGHGLFAIRAAPPHPNFVTLADMLAPGSGGAPGANNSCWNGANPGGDGSAIIAPPGSVSELPGRVRMLVAPRVAHENTSVPFTFHGVPGDQVRVYLARTPDFVFNEPFRGVNLTVQPPHARTLSFGTIPASGTLGTHVVLPDLGLDAKTYFLQSVFMSAAGQWFLGSPVTLIDLDSSF